MMCFHMIINIILNLVETLLTLSLTTISVERRQRLPLVPLDDPAIEASFANLTVNLQPALLREDGAEVSQEALHALLAFFG